MCSILLWRYLSVLSHIWKYTNIYTWNTCAYYSLFEDTRVSITDNTCAYYPIFADTWVSILETLEHAILYLKIYKCLLEYTISYLKIHECLSLRYLSILFYIWRYMSVYTWDTWAYYSIFEDTQVSILEILEHTILYLIQECDIL